MDPQDAEIEDLEALFAGLFRQKAAEFGMNLPKTGSMSELQVAFEKQMEVREKRRLAGGSAEEKAEVMAECLITFLEERFGTVTPSLQKRIRRAKPVTLKRWLRNFRMAPNLSAIFSPSD